MTSASEAGTAGQLLVIGAGRMGGAMIEGWIARGRDPRSITVIDPSADGRARLQARGVRVAADADAVAMPDGGFDVLVVAVKPQSFEAALPPAAPLVGAETLVVSVAAGKTVQTLRDLLGHPRKVIRAMPNTPAAIGRGITGCYAVPETEGADRALAEALLSAVGEVVWIEDEGLIDAVTAVSGSGPAYVFHMIEAMTLAGEEVGLPHETARRLARATVIGAAALADASPETETALREAVTSPAGTTAAALSVLMDRQAGLPPLMARAVTAARDRGRELAG
ncbi:MAG: pyrroline-5-carboxylate reductase [Tistrella sp.]|uniref:Pyrroline-5-carboxylate reductase n=1 Tax=Tistrella mobilis TaxID=171437 RepID=A0A3B9IM38_9PROT|nr:pyrroline-5-carboxylate reductase [Tistrella sp.]MAD39370.1 pyrroline-5-carboxylate reductase [Tistrella sp.]MBA76386.1 pyrroline-5-carboxylate reductase [Tistrella sp.]HAE48932.1 pyrroline-5-carboxylate reductase [Tistrella mobilis]